MADYSAFAPARPPPHAAAGPAWGAPIAGGVGQGPAGGYGAASAQGGAAGLQGAGGQGYGGYGAGAAAAAASSFASGSTSVYPSSSSSSSGAYNGASSSYGGAVSGGYSAANRPRPQLSPVATSSSSFAAQGGGGPGGNGLATGGGAAPNGVGASGAPPPRLPRKASLPSLPAAEGGAPNSDFDAASAPPLPPLPSFSNAPSAHSSYASSSLPSSSHTATYARDSTGAGGGEAVFDGAALAAAVPVVAPPPRSTSASAAQQQQQVQSQAAAAAKRANPLEDLIATEQQYVEELGAVIKRVAAAWSRTNFPPPELDSMFRAVEAVYRINKTLLGKLLAIGPSPSSPKALGDLLMRWIPDLEPAYSRYATTLQLDFDRFLPVQSNPNLAPILAQLPYPVSLPPPQTGDEGVVTLDALFALPVHRVKYYQKLYAKLLRSTQEGRSDHALLVAANEKLERLERGMEASKGRSVLGELRGEEQGQREEEERGAGRREKPPRLDVGLANGEGGEGGQREEVKEERSSGESGRLVESPTSSSYRSSGATGATGTSTANTSATNGVVGSGGSPIPGYTAAAKERETDIAPLRVEELEQRLNTERTLDIFSMQPRKCKLQMQPPNLPYLRQLRASSPCTLTFVPSSDPSARTVSHPRAHIVLLTDLFLICERPSSASHAALPEGQDLALLYPPLAGKHLQVEEGPREGQITVTVMRKERLTFAFGDDAGAAAREWVREIEEAVRFGMSQAPVRSGTSSSSTGARSPLSPTFNGFSRAGAVATPTGTTSSSSGHASPLSGAFPHQQHVLPNIQTSLPPSSSLSGHVTSPLPASPLSSNGMGYGAAPSNTSGLQPQDRRAFSNPSSAASASSSSVARPERKASMGVSPSPSSANFPHSASASASGHGSNSSRGPSPYASGEYGQYQSPPLQQGRQSPYGAPSPHQYDFAPPPPPPMRSPHQQAYPTYPMLPSHSHSQGDFAPPNAPFASGNYPRSASRSSSRLSNGSESSGGYGAPPPMPKELSYNGMDISGRGGPIYPTSMRTDPGAGGGSYGPGGGGGYDSRSMASGRSGLLSPGNSIHLSRSADGLRVDPRLAQQQYRSPSQALLEDRAHSAPGASRSMSGSKLSLSHSQSYAHGGGLLGAEDVSPPTSPVEPKAPEKTRIIAEMRCKVFLQQHHAQWKSLGTAKLKLFLSQPSMTKQLVVDSDKKGQTLVSTIVLTDGVERVGKTGVAIELSDKGDRTGIVYMLQMKTEQSATGLFEQFLVGSDRLKR
ncbi:hypothetical protein JCM6882_005956 [Rhodosporidiobolus microsporus]